MNRIEIRDRIKKVIANVTGLDPREIPDGASFIDELELDSLSMFEIGVDVDYEFQLGIAEERLGELRTVEDAVALVVECRAGEMMQAKAA